MLSSTLYQHVCNDIGITMLPPKRTAIGVGGERVPILGEVRGMTMLIQHRQVECPTMSVVDGLIHDIVLGRDFCCQMGTVLDDTNGTLQIQDIKLTLPTYEEIRPRRSRVKTACSVVIPPRTETVIWAKLHPVDGRILENDPQPLEGVIEPNGKLAQEDLLVPRAVASMSIEGTVPVRVTNATTEEAKILRGSDIGTFYTLSADGGEYDWCEDREVEANSGNGGAVPGLDLTCSDLSEVGQRKVKDLTMRFQDIFSTHPDDIGTTNLLQHPIDTGNAPPVKQQPRRIPHRLREQVEAQKARMLSSGVIEDSSSPWCSPVVLVKKRDGSARFCVDLRAVNSATQPVAYPLPRIDEALDGLSGARFFTTLDMTAGYWQVEIAPEDREKTAFSTGRGLHQFRKMAMGLRNAGATFQRLMEFVLAGVDAKTCLVYLDDVVLFNKTEEGHLETLKEVFEAVRKAGLKLKPQKCFIGKKEVTFLGHHVTREGIRPDPSNIEKVLNWPKPATDGEMKSFLGLCGYYAKFIPEYAEVSRPLRETANQKGVIRWTTELEAAFGVLKKSLASPPVLSLPTFNGTFRLYTDACNTSVGAVLTEEVDGDERVIAYESKVLSKQQRRWPTYDKELWAVVHAIRRFRQYTTGAQFQVITDHKPLANIPKSIDPQRDGTGRRGRWATELSSFDFKVTIKAGTEHTNADALSRKPPLEVEQSEAAVEREDGRRNDPGGGNARGVSDYSPSDELQYTHFERPQHLYQVWSTPNSARLTANSDGVGQQQPNSERVTEESACLLSATEQTKLHATSEEDHRTATDDERTKLLGAQCADTVLVRLKELLERARKPSRRDLQGELGEWAYIQSRWSDLTIEEGLVGLRCERRGRGAFQILVPSELRENVLQWVHEHPVSGHMGTQKTVGRLLDRFSWPGMCHQAKTFCRSCVPCQRRNRPTPRRRAPMISEITNRPFERIALDITEMPVSTSGNKYALVVMDYFSKYVRIFPMKDQKAITVSSCLMDWVYELGVPERLHSDQGPQFESTIFQELCKQLGIKKTRTTPYHPQSDGMVERFMRTLKDMVAKYIDAQGLTWDRDVQAYAMAYNSAVHDTTGYSPFFLIHGFEPRLPVDVAFGTPQEIVEVRSFPENRRRALMKAFGDVRRATTKAAAEAAKRYDQDSRYTAYQIGDKVWIRDHTASVGGKPKLGMPYKGPGVIVRAIGEAGKEVTYQVRLPGSKDRIIHHNDLKPLIQRPGLNNGIQEQEESGAPQPTRSSVPPIPSVDDKSPGIVSRAPRTSVTRNGSQAMPPHPPSSSYQHSTALPREDGHTLEGEIDRGAENIEDTESGSSSSWTPQEMSGTSEDSEVTESGSSSLERPDAASRCPEGNEDADGESGSTAQATGSDTREEATPIPNMQADGDFESKTPPQEPRSAQSPDTPYDESMITPYITRSGRQSIPVMTYQAGVSPTVAELKHKYELFLKRKGEGE